MACTMGEGILAWRGSVNHAYAFAAPPLKLLTYRLVGGSLVPINGAVCDPKQ